MRNREKYVVLSLEQHLFFARIMKEHSLFLAAGFPPCDASLAKDALRFKDEFEKLLLQAVKLSNGIIRRNVLCSGEILTEFTECAEKQTQQLTGIDIDECITDLEKQLTCGENVNISPELVRHTCKLNQNALQLLDGLIRFNEKILNEVLGCRMFTLNYPLLIEHILREAKLYRSFIRQLESGGNFDCQTIRQTEQFWNRIMMEHAFFIRGLLDPTEHDLIETSDAFAKDFAHLLAKCRETNDKILTDNGSLETTKKFRDFKAAGTKGIECCEIRSIILPLLADHVLREANHYIRLLCDPG